MSQSPPVVAAGGSSVAVSDASETGRLCDEELLPGVPRGSRYSLQHGFDLWSLKFSVLGWPRLWHRVKRTAAKSRKTCLSATSPRPVRLSRSARACERGWELALLSF